MRTASCQNIQGKPEVHRHLDSAFRSVILCINLLWSWFPLGLGVPVKPYRAQHSCGKKESKTILENIPLTGKNASAASGPWPLQSWLLPQTRAWSSPFLMNYLIYSMEAHWRAFLRGNCVITFTSSFRDRVEGTERIMTTHPWNCYRIKPVFPEWMGFLMQLVCTASGQWNCYPLPQNKLPVRLF